MKRNRKYIVFAFCALAVLVTGVVGVVVLHRQDKQAVVAQPIAVLRTADYHSLAFSAYDPNIVFFGHHDGIMRSNDGGKTWQSSVYMPNFDVMALAIDLSASHLMYLAGHLIFQVSQDGGSTWNPIQNNLPSTDIHGFTASPEDPKRLFAFIYRNGFFRSTDGGLYWERLSTQLPPDIMVIAASGGDPETLYAGSMRAGVFRSTNGGQTWALANSTISGGVMAIAIDYRNPKTVYVGGNKGFYKSTDGGNSWRKVAFPGNTIAALAVSPTQPGLLLAINVAMGNGEVYRSEDGGMTWGK